MPGEWNELDPRLRLEPGDPGSRALFLTRSLSDTEKRYEVLGGRLTPKPLTVYDTVLANSAAGRTNRMH